MTTCANGCRDDDGNQVRCDGKRQACDECHRRLRRWVVDIPNLYALLPFVLERGSVQAEKSGRSTKGAYPPVPLRPEVADLRDERRDGRDDEARGVLGVVEGWARIVRTERDLTASDRATVTGECLLLLNHSDWIIEQPWVDECMAEIGKTHRDLAHACGEHGYRKVATCRTLLGDDQVECGGSIMPTRIGMGARCVKCQRYWGEHELNRLGLVENSA